MTNMRHPENNETWIYVDTFDKPTNDVWEIQYWENDTLMVVNVEYWRISGISHINSQTFFTGENEPRAVISIRDVKVISIKKDRWQ